MLPERLSEAAAEESFRALLGTIPHAQRAPGSEGQGKPYPIYFLKLISDHQEEINGHIERNHILDAMSDPLVRDA